MAEVRQTLLLVDKNPSDLDTLARRLRRRGFDVIAQSSSDEALRAVAFEKVDLVVLDYSTPEQDGLHLLRRLRAQTRSARLPIILIVAATEKGEASGVLAALDQGANDYVSKPIDIDVLLASIRTFLPDSQILASLSGNHPPVKMTTGLLAGPLPNVAVPILPSTSRAQQRPSLPSIPSIAIGPARPTLPPSMPTSAAPASAPPAVAAMVVPLLGPKVYNSLEHPGMSDAGLSAENLQAAADVLVGTVLDGKYRLDSRIDSGGFGSVYRGTHLGLRRPVAVKILHFHLLDSQQIVRRFRREAISGGQIKHPNSVAILDAGATPSGTPFLVMEFLDGVTLETEMRTRGVLRFARVATIIGQICDFLIHAHAAGVIHRDIKPANFAADWKARACFPGPSPTSGESSQHMRHSV